MPTSVLHYETIPNNEILATVNKESYCHAPGQGPCCPGLGYVTAATHTVSLIFQFVFLSMGFSHTPYMSLDMTHTTKITLSCRHNICCGLLSVSISVIKLTLFICLPIRKPRLPSPLSLSQTHTQLLLPLPFPTTVSLSHTHTKLSPSHPGSYFSHKHLSTS